jgi:8-amino-7-oxononanoate synthase
MQPRVFSVEQRMAEALETRSKQGRLRRLVTNTPPIDFCSNDYLGFARSEEFAQYIVNTPAAPGSTGSRLLSGNSFEAEELEKQIATFHAAEAALLFNSGYDANLGLFSSLGDRGDTILYDALMHASVRDGIRLSRAEAYSFRHDDLNHLEERLNQVSGQAGEVFVAVESIYSMDGDEGALAAIAKLCSAYQAHLIVDEAHGTGVRGMGGEGLVQELGIQDRVFARVHTFGKALGCHGAVVVGSGVLREWLVNYARPFIYSTALPPTSLNVIKAAYTFLASHPTYVSDLHNRVAHFCQLAKQKGIQSLLPASGPIQCLIVPGNAAAKCAAQALQENGLDVRAILSPTVAAGSERLRICIHRYNTEAEIDLLTTVLAKIQERNYLRD